MQQKHTSIILLFVVIGGIFGLGLTYALNAEAIDSFLADKLVVIGGAWFNAGNETTDDDVVIDNNGNTAIGTNSPDSSYRLTINQDFGDFFLKLNNTRISGTIPTFFKLGTDNALVINNSGKDTLTLKDGNVGINNLIKGDIPDVVYANDRSLCAGANGNVVFCYLLNKPIITFSVDNSQIKEGSAASLSWTTDSAVSCVASGGWSGTKNTGGSESVSPLKTTDYIISCTNSSGESTASVKVRVYGYKNMDFGETGANYGESCVEWLNRRTDILALWGTSCFKWGHTDTETISTCAYTDSYSVEGCVLNTLKDNGIKPISGSADEWAPHTKAWFELK